MKPNRRKKRPIESIDDIPTPELIMKIKNIPDYHKQYRSFIAALWLFGNRVSELLGIKTRIRKGDREYIKTSKRGKQIKLTVPIYHTYKTARRQELGLPEWEVEPPKTVNYTIDEVRGIVRIQGVHTLKRMGRPTHTYVAGIKRQEELSIWKIIQEYVDNAEENKPVWRFSRKSAWYYCNKYLGIPPHKLRGMRATRDSTEFNMDASVIKKKFNWSSTDMALHYAQKNVRDVENVIEKNS